MVLENSRQQRNTAAHSEVGRSAVATAAPPPQRCADSDSASDEVPLETACSWSAGPCFIARAFGVTAQIARCTEEGLFVAWVEAMHLPLVLAGPILRRVDP